MEAAASEEESKVVEMVPAASDPDPKQQQDERDVMAHQDSEEEEEEEAAEAALRLLQQLRERISRLLGPAGHRRARAVGVSAQRCWAFVETELTITAAFLTALSPQDLDFEAEEWLEWLEDTYYRLDRVDPSNHTLLRRALQCFHRRKRYSHLLPSLMVRIYYISEQRPSRYGHLLLTSSDLGLTPQLTEAGALPLVGIDRPVKKIFRWLAHQEKMDMNLRVMSVVGPVGIGKTTLVVELHNRVRRETSGGPCYFHCNVLAQTSRGTDRNIHLLQYILSKVSEEAAATRSADDPSQAKTMEQLVHLVSENLRDKRYFVIIDDIWEASDWEKIKGAFPNNNLDSRILVTTRSTSIAWASCSSSYDGGLVHKMKPLNQIETERLLLEAAAASEDGCLPDDTKLFCDEILMRCDGIPLFITCMADWLKQQRLQRLHRRQDDDEEHQRSAIYCEEEVPQLPERLKQALSSGFIDLPNDHSVRLLLFYMSMFPYGYKFEKDRLILKWIHEGFVEPFFGSLMGSHLSRATAEAIFSQLMHRNVITYVASNCKHKQDEGEDCQWQVNHFMQQFLASKCAEMGFIFTSSTLKLLAASAAATTIECGNQTSSRMPRRLALHHPHGKLSSLLENLDLSQTRSLAVSGTVSEIPLQRFVNLVLLDLEGWENIKDQNIVQICESKMIFLSYLSVRNTRVSKLPHEIKELQLLGTLDVSYTQITELPLELFELRRLMQLDLRGTRITQLPNQIMGLQASLTGLLIGGEGTINSIETAARVPDVVARLYDLQTLATVDLTEQPASFVSALGTLHDLKVLAVTWSFHQSTNRAYCEALLSSIVKWKYLKSLTIHCRLGCSMDFLCSLERFRVPKRLEKFKVTAGRFACVPPWIHGLEHLVLVQITVCTKQATDDLKILGSLPKLQCLILGLDFIPGQAIEIENQGFRELQRFSVDCLKPWLTFKAGSMRKLTYLQLKLHALPASNTEVPSGIGNLQSLSEVALCYNARYANNTYVSEIVKVVTQAVAEHLNQVDLFINGIQDYDVQAVHELTENAVAGTLSGTDAGARDDAEPVEEEATSAAVQSEITEA